MKGRAGRILVASAAAGIAVLALAAPAGSPQAGRPAALTLRVGFSAASVSNVDPKDARTATALWADVFARRRGFEVTSRAEIFDDLKAVEAAVQARAVDLVFVVAQEFLQLRGHSLLVPIVTSTLPRTGQEEFVLLVRTDSGFASPRDLRGKRLAIEETLTGTLPVLWLETLLWKDGAREDAARFFSLVKKARGASQTVLPVFFGHLDGCVATRRSFEIAAELNPQVGERLRAIAVSAGFASCLGCLRKDFAAVPHGVVLENLVSLHDDPQGRQLLALFSKDRLVSFDMSQLATTEALLEEHAVLSARLPRRR
jgi:ABC-type phosphate/phosphonate transport system substrate-binding protein